MNLFKDTFDRILNNKATTGIGVVAGAIGAAGMALKSNDSEPLASILVVVALVLGTINGLFAKDGDK